MSLNPQFSIHLHGRQFVARTHAVDENACALTICEPDSYGEPLTIFLPADKFEQVQRIADALNEMGKPAEANPIAA